MRPAVPYFRYHSSDSPDELIRKYKIRFNEEDRKILADGIDGSFAIYPYGLDKDILPEYSLGTISQSEDHVILDGVIYDGSERENGQMEICDQVPGMKGKNTAIEGKFAPMLVPWSILTPEYDRINPDTGNIETLQAWGSGAGLIILHLPRKILKIPILIQGCGSKRSTVKQGKI